ncbi:MAG TPA: DUF2752 domain-containing protein [Verrucomicrobiae bacterium]|nr:DUF2752 domain-containing protein [Verrucomicrobiae bacterium]
MEAPPVIQRSRRYANFSAAWLAGGLAFVAGMAVLFEFNPSTHAFYPRCLLYTSTGILCPGCGSLRAFHQLLHGHVLTALRCNALLVASLPLAAYFCVKWAARWMAGEPLPLVLPNPLGIKIFMIVMIVFTVVRNIHCAPFIYLAPP